jgi:hypothetical protein
MVIQRNITYFVAQEPISAKLRQGLSGLRVTRPLFGISVAIQFRPISLSSRTPGVNVPVTGYLHVVF